MKCLQRCCSLLLCFLLLSAVFSLNANAESPDTPHYICEVSANSNNYGSLSTPFEIDPFNEDNQYREYTKTVNYKGDTFYSTTNYDFISIESGKPIIKKGNEISVNAFGLFFYNDYIINGGTYTSTVPDNVEVNIYYTDGTLTYPNDVEFNRDGNLINISFSFIPKLDVDKIRIQIDDSFKFSSSGSLTYKTISSKSDTYKHKLDFEQDSEQTGLIKNIINWIKDIFNSIKDGFSNIGKWFAELPTKLWEVISEGLKSLFVPTTEEITQYKDKWEELLSDRFGALYQSFNIIIDFASDLLNYITDDVSGFGSFAMPYVSLEPIGIPFEFGGYSIRLTEIHPLFDDLMTMVRYFSDFIVTLLFVNGLRKKYDEVFGG